MNYSDSERIASFLEKNDLKPISDPNKASLVIFNTCGVRQMAEDRVYGQIHNLRKKNPKIKIALTGCVAHRKDVQRRLEEKVDLFCSIKEFTKEFEKLGISTEKKDNDYFKIRPKYGSDFQAEVPIMTGCNNFCAYCVVPYARGRETSRPAKEILKEIKELISKGYKEITLLGQNVNSYKDNSINFAKLLKTIDALPGNFWIRFLTSHPKDMSGELIETIAKLEKVCEYVHLPIQAGGDEVLKRMNRKYTSKHYLGLINKIRKSFQKNKPGKLYALTTDIIVGFPGETRKQFEESARIMNEVKYDMAYTAQFSPRPETAAWKMKDNVTKEEKIKREKKLIKILGKTSLENNRKYVGKVFDVLIEKEKNGFYYGKTRTLKNVRFTISEKCKSDSSFGGYQKPQDLIGRIVPIKITKANIWNLEGVIRTSKTKIG